MAGEKLLTETQCRGAKASNKVFYLNDGGGLRLRVRPNGSRHRIYRYRVLGNYYSLFDGAFGDEPRRSSDDLLQEQEQLLEGAGI